ncbi:STAS/SEC14 domain-containing protein [Flagellimonas alvinocaridis]|uniref:STAS/SEC14 domain-containing protein n=1 Tax=Flagellimonas alvinocaridis TaxID=2530200 RepID=A0A4S8RGV0_9FLAO|nr:STAS/SEC14 domain-containing protein [Allomuricauda alvinocaridis]THV56761.1 STAS/SEC14 domain-containing protein [Allomuricauda alvinocaridis]
MITLEKLEQKDCYLFKITENIDEKSAEDFIDFLVEKAEKDEKIKLIGFIESFLGFESFKAFRNTMNLKLKAIKVIEKYAIVSDKDWIENLVPLADFLSPNLPMKQFDIDEYNEAVEWLAKDN